MESDAALSRLWLRCPEKEFLGGTYTIVEGRVQNRLPVWRQDGGNGLLFSNGTGQWAVSPSESGVKKGKAPLRSQQKHHESPPHTMQMWEVYDDGAWICSPGTRVVNSAHQDEAPKISMGGEASAPSVVAGATATACAERAPVDVTSQRANVWSTDPFFCGAGYRGASRSVASASNTVEAAPQPDEAPAPITPPARPAADGALWLFSDEKRFLNGPYSKIEARVINASPVWQQAAGSGLLYRGKAGRWIVSTCESNVSKNKGPIRSKSLEATVPFVVESWQVFDGDAWSSEAATWVFASESAYNDWLIEDARILASLHSNKGAVPVETRPHRGDVWLRPGV